MENNFYYEYFYITSQYPWEFSVMKKKTKKAGWEEVGETHRIGYFMGQTLRRRVYTDEN